MLDHVSLGISDLARARAFYEPVLAAIGMKQTLSHEGALAFGADYPAEFWIQAPIDGAPATCGNGTHICFRIDSKDAVDAFHKTGLNNGGTCAGKPGMRPHYHPNYYAAFLLDPDGHKIEALHYMED